MDSEKPLRTAAFGKTNLCLFLGPIRSQDARHELLTVMQSLTLADEVTLSPVPGPRGAGADGAEVDEVVCRGVDGENLALAALRAFRRATGWDAAPQRLTIAKRVPVAAGMGGGSADAAAALRLAAEASGLGDESLLHAIATELGADVPAQLRPGRALATGAGEVLTRLEGPSAYGVLVLPSKTRLSTADVFRRADEMNLCREPEELEALHADVSEFAADLPDALIHNDLEAAARSLLPEIGLSLNEAIAAGADRAFVSGSGPTVIGLFSDRDQARAASHELADRDPPAHYAEPVDARVYETREGH